MNQTANSKYRTGANSWGLRLLAIAFWLVVWQFAAFAVGSPLILAGPIDTLRVLGTLVVSARFWHAVGFSALRISLGLLAAFILGILGAFMAEKSRFVQEVLGILLGAIKSVPIVCFVVLLLIWFGSRNVSAFASFLVALPAFYFATQEGLANTDDKLMELAHVFNLSLSRTLTGIVFPGIHPFIMAAAKSAVGMSWKAGVAAELIGMPLNSMGERIYQTKLLLETGELFAWTIATIVLAWLFEKLAMILLKQSLGLSYRLACRTQTVSVQENNEPKTADQKLVVKLADVALAYNEQQVFNKLSFELLSGERLCFTDPSGAGKTSLLRLLAGLIEPTSGHIERHTRTTMLFQDTRLIPELNPVDNVALFAGERLSHAQIEQQLLALVDAELLARPTSELSGGEQRRVELVRTLMSSHELVLLDEPFTSLDEETLARAAFYILSQLHGRALVVSSHQKGTAAFLEAREHVLKDIRQG